MVRKAKEKFPVLVTPTGLAVYPYLNRPDTQFDPEGEFKVGLVLPASQAQGLMATIEKEMGNALVKAQSANPTKMRKIKLANPPYGEVLNEEGQDTGNIKFNFKMKAQFTAKDGTVVHQRPGIFDAAGRPLMGVNIGGGSKIKVSAELVPFFTDLVGAGITLRLKAVQVIDLVEYTGKSAEQYGFQIEEGYQREDGASNTAAQEVDDEADF